MGLGNKNTSDNTLIGDNHVNGFTSWILDPDSSVPYDTLRATLNFFPLAFSQLL